MLSTRTSRRSSRLTYYGMYRICYFINFSLDLGRLTLHFLNRCDFGVGSRMKEYASNVWKFIRPGGFLVCHSTLTNERTRTWLEAVRQRKGADETGIPADEYAELSLLEPHKRFQNSVTILQKRVGGGGAQFSEPLYSEYA